MAVSLEVCSSDTFGGDINGQALVGVLSLQSGDAFSLVGLVLPLAGLLSVVNAVEVDLRKRGKDRLLFVRFSMATNLLNR